MLTFLKKSARTLWQVAEYPFVLFDRFLEGHYLHYFHAHKTKAVATYLVNFKHDHPHQDDAVMHRRLQQEADRVCNFTDLAILRANIQKAKYTFWITAVMNLVWVIEVSGTTNPYSLASPVYSSMLTYIAAIVSITALYCGRVEGAMVSKIKEYEKELAVTQDEKPIMTEINLDFIPSTIMIKTRLNQTMTLSFSRQRLPAESAPEPQNNTASLAPAMAYVNAEPAEVNPLQVRIDSF